METSWTTLLPWTPRVAVVQFYEPLRGGQRTITYLKMFERIRKSKAVHAVVLDIDSPGGAAASFEYLHRVVSRLGQEKPVVAFVRGVGASGGYMLACAGSSIISLPGAILGSIGVISAFPVAENLLARLGVHFSVVKSGAYKGTGAFYRQPTEEELLKQQDIINDYYDAFVELVAQSRHLPTETVRQYATGEIFTGRRALTIGMVDELGDLELAVNRAAALAGIPPLPITISPQRPFPARLLARSAQSLVEALLDGVEMGMHR